MSAVSRLGLKKTQQNPTKLIRTAQSGPAASLLLRLSSCLFTCLLAADGMTEEAKQRPALSDVLEDDASAPTSRSIKGAGRRGS